MLQPLEENRFNNLDELLDSNYLISEYIQLFTEIGNGSKLEKAQKAGRLVSHSYMEYEDFAAHKVAFPEECEKFDLTVGSPHGTRNGMYKIVTPFEKAFILLYAGPFSPFLNYFKKLMDLSASGGLQHYWNTLYQNDISTVYSELRRKIRMEIEDEKDILDLDSIAPFFLILAFGFSLALFSLLCEIFHHDFLTQLNFSKKTIKNYLKKKFCGAFKYRDYRRTRCYKVRNKK